MVLFAGRLGELQNRVTEPVPTDMDVAVGGPVANPMYGLLDTLDDNFV